MNYSREIAGVFVGAGALLLIWQNHYSEAMTLLVGMMAFFIGERNGARKASQSTS